MGSFFSSCMNESTVHGFPYVVQKKFHILERIFWFFILILSTVFTLSICLDVWNRYQHRPIVLSVQNDIRNWNFSYPAHTICSNYSDVTENELIVNETWNVTSNDTQEFQYYMNFLNVLSKLNYKNLNILEPYKNDPTLNSIDFLKIIKKMRYMLYKQFLTDEFKKNQINIAETISYAPIITEIGYCLTDSVKYSLQYPFKENYSEVNPVRYCRPMDTCTIKISPLHKDGKYITMYFHAIDAITTPDTPSIKIDLEGDVTGELFLNFVLDTVEKEVKKLPIAYRKCRYNDENNLNYFDEYNLSNCRIDCRIKSALKLCKCKPYFYIIGPNERICDLKGLLCLAQAKWPFSVTKECQCLDLCEHMSFSVKQKMISNPHGNFQKSVTVTLYLPSYKIQKRVVFSVDQLVVSFGGAASFFLGCNFMSFVEILYFLIEHLKKLFKRTKI